MEGPVAAAWGLANAVIYGLQYAPEWPVQLAIVVLALAERWWPGAPARPRGTLACWPGALRLLLLSAAGTCWSVSPCWSFAGGPAGGSGG